MSAGHYDWGGPGDLPQLRRHSEVKHALLADYLVDYFLTLVSSPRQDKIRLTIIDGFCGGGRYLNERGVEAPGSPIVILRALREAQARIHEVQQREKPVDIDVELVCIDQDKRALAQLRFVLDEEGYGALVRSGHVKLVLGTFEQHAEEAVKNALDRSKRSGKAIFVLDQYGYSEVPLAILQRIFALLAKAEIILTFNVDSLINFLCDGTLASYENKTGFEGALIPADLDSENRGPHWRRQIQAKLYANITTGCGAQHFTPFFIRPDKGHGDFWLLHLSQHSKARDVMAEAHWRHNNHFVHYGDAGLDMFGVGYVAKLDATDRPQAAFEFDNVAAARSRETMLDEIPRILSATREGIPFGKFFVAHCNNTPTTRAMIEKTVLELLKDGLIDVLGDNGSKRHVSVSIRDEHLIRLPPQKIFSF